VARVHNSELKGRTYRQQRGGAVVLECARTCTERLGFLGWPKARPLFHLLSERACAGSWENAAGQSVRKQQTIQDKARDDRLARFVRAQASARVKIGTRQAKRQSICHPCVRARARACKSSASH
jgi:hypothetical protein